MLALVLTGRAFGETAPEALGDCAINVVFGTFNDRGFVGASGFAFDGKYGAPVRKVEMYLDGVAAGDVSLRGLRPDVLTHFSRPDYLWSGWNGTLSLEGLRPGRHTVQFVAISHSGKPIPCGARSFEVTVAAEPPARSRWRIGVEILLRSSLFLAWCALVGLPLAIAARHRQPAFAAPVLGLGLLGVFVEAGGALHVRPSRSALVLTVLSIAALGWMWISGRLRLRSPSRPVWTIVAIVGLFCVIGVVPLASHGEGTVLGDIDDATRECVVADSISRFGWRVPGPVRGAFATLRHEIGIRDIRPGEMYLLSALGDAFGVRAHVVHSVAMLAMGSFVIWSAGLLARTVLPGRRRRWWWLAPLFVAANSVVLSTLYWQHLGSLMGAALFVSFTALTIRLARSRRFADALCVAITVGSAFVFYPEAVPVWALTGLLACATVSGRSRRRKAAGALLLAVVLSVAVNPVGVARFSRYAQKMSQTLSGPRERTMTGDTHYFPPPTVIAGLEAYREDARAPLGAVRRVLVPVGAIAILATALLGWSRLSRRGKAVAVTIILPTAAALVGNVLLEFPYGYAKILPTAAAMGSVSLVFFAAAAAEATGRPARDSRVRMAIAGTLVLALLLAIPSARHVWRRALAVVPVFDPAWRVLPALGEAAGAGSVIVVDQPGIAPGAWIRYFLGENAVVERAALPPPDGSRRYLLVDRRKRADAVPGPGWITSRNFALAPLD
ncbi:MAG TPA: hypothetical protein VIY96_03775 [Thermoanaerobaculia bacterium]